MTAINEGRTMHHLIGNTYCARGSNEAAFLALLFVKTLPLSVGALHIIHSSR